LAVEIFVVDVVLIVEIFIAMLDMGWDNTGPSISVKVSCCNEVNNDLFTGNEYGFLVNTKRSANNEKVSKKNH